MDNKEDIEVEIFRSKENIEQLWKRQIVKDEAAHKEDWQVDFIHEDFHFLMDEDRSDEIPEYAVKGRMKVSSDGKVIQAFEPNKNFDAAKIAAFKSK